jgi:hypothetical protein
MARPGETARPSQKVFAKIPVATGSCPEVFTGHRLISNAAVLASVGGMARAAKDNGEMPNEKSTDRPCWLMTHWSESSDEASSEEMSPLWRKVFVLSSSRNERRFDTAHSCARQRVR